MLSKKKSLNNIILPKNTKYLKGLEQLEVTAIRVVYGNSIDDENMYYLINGDMIVDSLMFAVSSSYIDRYDDNYDVINIEDTDDDKIISLLVKPSDVINYDMKMMMNKLIVDL